MPSIEMVLSILGLVITAWCWNSLYQIPERDRFYLVRFGAMQPEPLKPGLRLAVWPVEKIYGFSNNKDKLDLTVNSVPTADGRKVSLQVLMLFRVEDPVRAVAQTGNVHNALAGLARKVAQEQIGAILHQNLRGALGTITMNSRDRMAQECQPWGIAFLEYRIGAIKGL